MDKDYCERCNLYTRVKEEDAIWYCPVCESYLTHKVQEDTPPKVRINKGNKIND